ncbi:MAG: squalene/phytoene synthase family protein, partial [Gammaproteobacteria bacterium]|nr:squalene/phytoene synthase family protein [Gammaproteobacteria bacterium]
TELFCNYSDKIALNSKDMVRLAPSFGQGLQMTNILKDIWDDYRNGNCWLPADIFRKHGCELAEMKEESNREKFNSAIEELVAITHGHLRNALEYSLLIPPQESGVRKFLLWNVNMAISTIRNIHERPGYRSGEEVKISKAHLIKTILLTNAAIKSDHYLDKLFNYLGRGIPCHPIEDIFFEEAASFSSFQTV